MGDTMNGLILNGDDFGMNQRCSLAIAEAFARDILTDTTMMATGEYFSEAVALAREKGFDDRIGIHLNLTEGEPITVDIREIPLFVIDGKFHKAYLKRPRSLTDAEKAAVYRELSAQAARLENAGIRITHADSHHYIHTFTHLAPIAAKVCRQHGIRRIRLNRTFDTPSRPKIIDGRIPNEYWREQGFVTSDHFGRLSDIEGGVIPDNTEIMLHPDYDKNGILIDRTGVKDGCATGKILGSLW